MTTALAVDVIAAVMDGSHNFLAEKLHPRYLRGGEVQLTRLADRRPWETWDADGRHGMAERAQAEAERLLREHLVAPLDDYQERLLDQILES